MNARPLTVLSVAYPLAPVGPDAVGGAEQVLSAVDGALAAAGWAHAVPAGTGYVELQAIDVGQGDAVALRTPAGR